MVLFGIDVIGLIVGVFPQIIPTIVTFVPPTFGALGEWANCVGQYGTTSELCQGM